MSTATHAVDLRTKAGTELSVVLKHYRDADEIAPLEWQRLQFADRLPVPSPTPLAFDQTGEWFGNPALVMKRLPGRPFLSPADTNSWLDQIAATLVLIQDASTTRTPPAIRQPHSVEDWNPPAALRSTPLVEQAIAAVRKNLPAALRAERAFGHSDYHPGNLLWSRAKLTGIADWSHAKIGPRALEVAYCRTEIAVLIGSRAADAFRSSYERAWGGHVDGLAVWDLASALSGLCWGHLWVQAYREQGRADLSWTHARHRIQAFVRRALGRL